MKILKCPICKSMPTFITSDLRMPKRVPQTHSWVVMSENKSGDQFLIADCDRFQDAVKYAAMQPDPSYVRKMMVDPRTSEEYEEPFLYDTRVKFTNKAWNDNYMNGKSGV